MAKWRTFLVSVIVSSRRTARGKEKSISRLSCPGLHNLPFTFCIFLFESEKQRTQSATDVLVQSAWYMNSVSMQIVILGRFLGTAEKTEGLLCKRDRGHD